MPDQGLLIYARTKFVFVNTYLILACFSLGSILAASWNELTSTLLQTLVALAVILVFAIVFGLARAATQMRNQKFPRLVLSFGSTILVFSVLSRIPIWAYLDGAGIPQLTSTVDWTQSMFFLLDLFIPLGVYAGAAWFFWWLIRRYSPMKPLALIIASILVFIPIASNVASSHDTGAQLKATGLAEYAMGSFPSAACLGSVKAPAQAVWILAAKDGRISVLDRSETAEPLPSVGLARSLPSTSYSLVYVTYENNLPSNTCDKLME